MARMESLKNIPNEMLWSILINLELNQVGTLKAVSKKWKELTEEEQFSKVHAQRLLPKEYLDKYGDSETSQEMLERWRYRSFNYVKYCQEGYRIPVAWHIRLNGEWNGHLIVDQSAEYPLMKCIFEDPKGETLKRYVGGSGTVIGYVKSVDYRQIHGQEFSFVKVVVNRVDAVEKTLYHSIKYCFSFAHIISSFALLSVIILLTGYFLFIIITASFFVYWAWDKSKHLYSETYLVKKLSSTTQKAVAFVEETKEHAREKAAQVRDEVFWRFIDNLIILLGVTVDLFIKTKVFLKQRTTALRKNSVAQEIEKHLVRESIFLYRHVEHEIVSVKESLAEYLTMEGGFA